MEKDIKNGQEVLKDFITDIQKDDSLDTAIVKVIQELCEANKLTKINLINKLEYLRENNETK